MSEAEKADALRGAVQDADEDEVGATPRPTCHGLT